MMIRTVGVVVLLVQGSLCKILDSRQQGQHGYPINWNSSSVVTSSTVGNDISHLPTQPSNSSIRVSRSESSSSHFTSSSVEYVPGYILASTTATPGSDTRLPSVGISDPASTASSSLSSTSTSLVDVPNPSDSILSSNLYLNEPSQSAQVYSESSFSSSSFPASFTPLSVFPPAVDSGRKPTTVVPIFDNATYSGPNRLTSSPTRSFVSASIVKLPASNTSSTWPIYSVSSSLSIDSSATTTEPISSTSDLSPTDLNVSSSIVSASRSESDNLTTADSTSQLSSTISVDLTSDSNDSTSLASAVTTPISTTIISVTGGLARMNNGSFSPSKSLSDSYPSPPGSRVATNGTSCSTPNSTALETTMYPSSFVPFLGSYPLAVTAPSSGMPFNSMNMTSSTWKNPTQTQIYASGIVAGASKLNDSSSTGNVRYPMGGYNQSTTFYPSRGYPQGTAPAPTGTASGYTPYPRPYNSSADMDDNECGGTTVNIPDATLNWWYSTDVDFAVATFSAQFNNNDSLTGWTVLPATTTFNVTSALAEPTYSVTTEFNTYINASLEYSYQYTTEPPDYVSTAVITQTAIKPLNTSTGIGSLIPSDAIVTQAPASTVIPGPASAAVTALTNTPFVYFSSFAIDVEKPTRARNGSMVCTTSRRMHALQSPFALYYAEEDPVGQTEVTGDLPDEFMGELFALRINMAQMRLGTYAAEPTLLVVVEEVYVAEAVLAKVFTEEAQSTLLLPSAAAASFVTLTAQVESSESALLLPSSTTGNFVRPTGVPFIAQTEIVEPNLLLPTPRTQVRIPQVTGTVSDPVIVGFTAVVGQSKTTFLAPSNKGGVITTTIQGGIVITAKAASPSATAVEAQQPASDSIIDAGVLGGLVGAVQSGAGAQALDVSTGSSGTSNSGSGSSGSGSGSLGSDSESSESTSDSGLSGSSGSSSGSSGSGSSGSGTNNNPIPAQESSNLANLFSVIQKIGSTVAAQATSNAGVGASGNTQNSGSSSSGSDSGDASSGSSNSGGPVPAGSSSSEASPGESSADDYAASGSSSSGSDNGQANPNGNTGSSNSALGPIPVVIGGAQTTIQPSSNVVIGSQTLVLGGPAITVSGTRVSLGTSAIIIGTETHGFAAPEVKAPTPIGSSGTGSRSGSTGPSLITVGDSTVTQAPVPVYVVGGQTVQPGQTITVNKKAISIGSGGAFVIDGSSISMAVPGSPQTFTSAGETIVVRPTPAYVLSNGETLLPGGSAITVDGTQYSLASSASALIIDGTITSELTSMATQPPLALTLGSNTFTANGATQFLLASGNVLTPGGQATISGTTIKLESGGSIAVINGVTQTLSPPIVTPAPLLTVGGTVFKPNLGSTYGIAGQELTPGGVITAEGTTISLAADASLAVINGVTKTLSAITNPQLAPSPTQAAVLTLGGKIYTAISGSTFIISGSTLTPGGVLTLDSGSSATTLSLGASGAGDVVVNGVTSTISGGASTMAPSLTIAGQVYSADASGDYTISGKTLVPGGSEITFTVNGNAETASLSPDGSTLVLNGFTSTLSAVGYGITPGPLTIDGEVYSALSGGSNPTYIISGQILTRGGVITFSDNSGVRTISLARGGSALVVNGVTSTISMQGATVTPGPITINGQVFSTVSGQDGPTYIISGQILTEGGVVTFSDKNGVETISLSPGGNVAVINGVSSTIAPAPTITAAPEITIDGQIITPVAGSGTTYLVSGKMLTPGGSVVFSGPNGVETVSLSPDGSTLVEDVSGAVTTSALPTAFGVAQTAAPIITIGDETFTALPGPSPSYLLPDGKTLYPGGPALTETIHGSVYIVSLSPSATVLVIEDVGPNGVVTRTEFETLFPATITKGRGTATVITNINGAGTSRPTQGAGASTTNHPAGLQGAAMSDKQIGLSFAVAAIVIALSAILL